jgi:6-phosphogluconolactonase
MVPPEIRVFDDARQLHWAAATRFEELARVRAIEKKTFTAAISGGSTPRPLYELLGSATFAGRVRWANVHLFQVDERTVPPDDPQSNYRLIRESLLKSAPLPPENFHRMAAERPDHAAAAREYSEELRRVLAPAPPACPSLDLVFLGMGPDGHTASLFPGSPALEEHTAWVIANPVAQLKTVRLTLTFPVLNAAAHVIFIVTGDDKAARLREVMGDPSAGLPAQRVQPTSGRLSWYLDKGAAKYLGEAQAR